MDPVLEPFAEVAAQVAFSPPRIDLVANLDGTCSAEVATPEYWVEHIRRPVHFSTGVQTLADMGCRTFVEMGPKPVLLGMGRNCLPDIADALWLPSLRQGVEDWRQLLASLSALYVRGGAINWNAFDADIHCGSSNGGLRWSPRPFSVQILAPVRRLFYPTTSSTRRL